MTIFFSIECLRVGGAQTFVLRLAQALAREHKVFVYYQIWDYIAPDIVKKLAPDVPILTYKPFGDWFIRKFDRLFYKLKIDFSIRSKIIARNLRQTVLQKQADTVHSNMFKADYITVQALKNTGIPVIVTMHGSYESFLFHYQGKVPGEVILNYPEKLYKILRRINGLAYLTERNLTTVHYLAHIGKSISLNKKKIYNGFEAKFSKASNINLRSELGISPESVIFALVARGIPAKGWQEAIDAFLLTQQKTSLPTALLLIGDSDYVNGLKVEYKGEAGIYFLGHSDNPVDLIQQIDVGLLPSYYNESLPTVIIEYLYCGKPVITSDNGESAEMIAWEGRKAGFVLNIEREGAKINTSEFSEFMLTYLTDTPTLEKHAQWAKLAFSKFEMNKCTESYLKFYNSCIKNKM